MLSSVAATPPANALLLHYVPSVVASMAPPEIREAIFDIAFELHPIPGE